MTGTGTSAARASRTLRQARALLLVLLVLALACRDAPAPFDAGGAATVPQGPSWRLTYSPREDRTPAWSAGGDSVYYAAERHEEVPRSRGVLVGLPREGGAARPILGELQVAAGIQRWLATPAVARTLGRIAYGEMWLVSPLERCGSGRGAVLQCERGELVRPEPPLGSIMLRARGLDGGGPIEADPALRVDFERMLFDRSERPFGLEGVWRVRYHPIQVLYHASGDAAFRPSWSPDGRRVAYSDGLRLLLWTPGEPAAVPVPGTEDGIWAAWSPDGQWIAFTRVPRGDSLTGRCVCRVLGEVVHVQERTVYDLDPGVLVLVRPDGTGYQELGEGSEPAWAPDGRTLFFRRADAIWRVEIEGGGASVVPGTEGGREPAVSPDGRFLAFARPGAAGDHDLWVIELGSSR